MATTTHADHPHAELVRSIYDGFGAGDLEAVLASFDPEIEIRQSDEVPWGGVYRGHDGAVRFFTALTSHIHTQVDVDRLIVAGDAVVETGRTDGRAVESGREFSIDETHVWHVRDGKVVRMEAYVDNAAMLAAIA
jgi:hypothetical protein